MKGKIQKTRQSVKLDDPKLIESKTSFVMQFIFYFSFLLLGISGVYGCFYTTFSLPLILNEFIFFAVVFGAAFTSVFLIKPGIIFLLVPSLILAVYLLLINQSILNVLINQLTHGFFIAYNSVASAYAQKVQYGLFTFPTASAGTKEIIRSSTTFAVSTLFLYTFIMAWILVRRKNYILCFMITAPFLGISVVVGIMPHYTAAGSLYIFWAFLILNSSFLRSKSKFNKRKGIFYSGGKNAANPQALIYLPVLIACLMLVTVFFPMNSFKRSDFVKDLRISILSIPRIPSPIQIPIQSILGYNERINLQVMGNITFTGKTVLRIKSSGTEGDYLKGFVGSIYTGKSWDSLPAKEYEKLDSILNELKVQNFSSLFNKLLGRNVKPYDLTVQNMKRNSLRVYVPYGLSSSPEELTGIDFINDGYLRSGNSLFGLREYSMKATSLQIDAWKMSESMMNAFSKEQQPFIRAAIEYKDFVYSHYTQLPEALKEKLDKYLYEHNLNIKKYTNPNAFANAVITHIQSENSYTLSPGLTPEGRDFVEYFLFDNHRGYCVHFASATAALLRSAGVPARYVEGYAISPDDFKENSEWANIPDSRSHAWVEIYLSAVGWVPVEATPSAQRGIIDHEAAENKPSPINPSEDDVTDDKFYNHDILPSEEHSYEDSDYGFSETNGTSTGNSMAGLMRIFKISAMLILLAAILLANRKIQISFRKKRFAQEDSNKAAIAVYDYLVKLNVFVYSHADDVSSIPKELYSLVLKARFSQHMLSEQELKNLLVYSQEHGSEIRKTVSSFKRFIGMYIYVLF